MKANVLEAPDQPIVWKEVETPIPGPGEVVVKIKAAALNRRDYWISIGKYAGLKYPAILGSDGAGIVTEFGEGVDPNWLNKEVVINAAFNWGENDNAQGKDFKILGLPDDGTLAEYVKVTAENLFDKPAYLTWEQAAAFPLAGVTAFRALTVKAKAKKGDTVLISGVGSGTGTFALQFALAMGCRVFVTSGSGEKLDSAIQMGALAGVNYKAQDWAEELQHLSGGFDIIIDSALGEGFAKFPDLCKPGGRIVFFGGTAGDIPSINGRKVFWKQLQLLGSTMGNAADFKAMLEFMHTHQIIPVIDEVYPMNTAGDVIKKMGTSAQFGKLVLTI
ncbi:zinc-binding dehydrogenase [Mucilaginibacter auburnensis]|uniref:NADPH:quinone reductase-like Zn-dependent oxidoreductase n=1 Tax=Mucilaginibacter auburnensis TaxID=1457233 RepID=A0A2H9VMW3_9SPHI|nr:zinc-binding dehydrogenase [Mucilaginibacter auburnensis]PJJ79672.1 NADPH:quinone reductase-like Zn-dependent oxidoreductase [Mucilaginibacter auburnensis]